MDRVHRHFRDGKKIYPLHIDMAVTKTCNAKCIYCYGEYQQMTNESISHEALMHTMDELIECDVKSITFTGDGENTCNPHLYDAIEEAWLGEVDVGLATNGILLNLEKIERLLRTCTWLRFNLSAHGEEGYKAIHGVPEWERVQANIRMASMLKKQKSSKCTLGIQMVLMPQCLHHVLPLAKFAVQNELDYFVIKQFSDPGCDKMSRFNLDWYDDHATQSLLKTAQSFSTAKTQIVPKWKRIESKGKRPYNHCVDCPLIFQISGNGKCYPCGYLFNNEKYCYGDLNKEGLKHILDSYNYWNIVKHMRHTFDVHNDCTGCCRHDSTNEFVWRYLNPPKHINFI